MKEIVIDIYGGDNAPLEILKGAINALPHLEGYKLILVGKEKEINENLSKMVYPTERIEIINADDVILNDEVPTDAIRKKKDSSIVVAMNYLNANDNAVGFVSAGSTGAVLTGAVLLLKRIKGVNRPALAPILPTVTEKSVLLIDCGANVDPKAENLVQFAKIGSAYIKAMFKINNPKVSLLSNGVEDKKGNALNKEAFPLLKDSGINFVGNMEAREILSGEYDVVVTDGFSGNIALKASEGTALSLFSLIKQNIMEGGLRAKLGYLLLKPALKKVKVKMDYNDNGGATFLGLEKIIVKSHGSSKAKSITASLIQVKDLDESKVIETIKGEFCG